VAPDRLEVELDEEVLLSEPAAGLRALKDLGVRIALDGYGRGPTSLRCLQLGVLDTLKLAREWLRSAPDAAGDRALRVTDSDHEAVVGAVITLARELGLRVVAEADDPGQIAFLRRCGCTAVQGLMSDTPLPAEACTSWLRKVSRRRRTLATLRRGRPQRPAAQPGKAAVPARR
jgi:EAL domain-containing protein (putative c-di-GMP-specific phosphodiesterase class I)